MESILGLSKRLQIRLDIIFSRWPERIERCTRPVVFVLLNVRSFCMIYINILTRTVRTVMHSFGQPEETSSTVTGTYTEAELLDEIQTKV